MYSLHRQTPIQNLSAKDLHYLNLAVNSAYDSKFEPCHRIGSVIVSKQCLLCGRKPTPK